MIAVIQRVTEASVKIEGETAGAIGQGFVVLLGVGKDDNEEDIDWLSGKIASLRIFSDEEGKMNLSLKEVDGRVLLISQFTLHASTRKGNRPGYNEAAKPEVAIPLYEKMIASLQQKTGTMVETGQFGANMQVSLVNDGPVTIIIDTKNKK